MFSRLLTSTRYLIVIAGIGAFIGALALLLFASVREVLVLLKAFSDIGAASLGIKDLALELIQILDYFLLAVGFYIIALGLYDLFIDDRLEMPGWLIIHDLEDLKTKLLSVLIVIMAVSFLSQVVKWDGDRNILGYGVAIGVVIAALTYFSSVKTKKGPIKAEKKKDVGIEENEASE